MSALDFQAADPGKKEGQDAPLELSYCSGPNEISVLSEDLDRFSVKKDRAIQVLQADHRREIVEKQFNLIFQIMRKWLPGFKSQIDRAYVTTKNGCLFIVVVSSQAQYDEKLQDAVSDIEYTMSNDVNLDLIRIESIVLPLTSDEALASFMDPKTSFRL